MDQQIRTALENSQFQIELYREYLETTLFPDPTTQQEFRDCTYTSIRIASLTCPK